MQIFDCIGFFSGLADLILEETLISVMGPMFAAIILAVLAKLLDPASWRGVSAVACGMIFTWLLAILGGLGGRQVVNALPTAFGHKFGSPSLSLWGSWVLLEATCG